METLPLRSGDAHKALLVLGMHRSGTSATTRVLNLLGASLGDHLMEPGYSNDKGFWEHMDAYQIDDKLLNSLGMTWNDPRPMPEGWQDSPQAADALQQIKKIVERDFGDQPLWAIKDPRICRLVPLWHKALQNLGMETLAVLVLRHPDEIAGSLAIRDGLSRDQVYLLWARHLCEAERATRGLRRCVVRYDRLLVDWRAEMTCAAAALGMKWPAGLEAPSDQVERFLSRDSRHHLHVLADTPVPGEPWIDTIFREFSATASSDDWSRASAIVDQFEQVTSISDGYTKQVSAERDQLLARQSVFDNTTALLTAVQESVSVMLSEVEGRLRADAEVTRTAQQGMQAFLKELKDDLANMREREAETTTNLEEFFAAARQRDAGLLEKLLERNAELDALHIDVTRLARELDVTRSELTRQQHSSLAIARDLQRQLQDATAANVASTEELRIRSEEMTALAEQAARMGESLQASNQRVQHLQACLDYATLPWHKKLRSKKHPNPSIEK